LKAATSALVNDIAKQRHGPTWPSPGIEVSRCVCWPATSRSLHRVLHDAG